ncbi:hypothetical protein TNCV_4800211, partial [Trichonephila clavipes]
MFQIFKDKGLLFQETTLAMSLADGHQTTGEALTTQVMVEIEGRSVLTKFIILPKAKGNRTLLGTDFLSSAGLVLDVKNTCWYFWDNPTHKYPFGEELDPSSIVEKMSSNSCQLREGEGESLTSVCAQKEKLNLLLESFQNVFEPGGKATHILEHHINMGNRPPTSVPPYGMSPVKNCPGCIKYKASNQKPSGLLQTPVPAQRFETLAIDLFGPLPESKDGKRWILIIEDCTTRLVKLFALPNATAKECAITLIEEVLLRYPSTKGPTDSWFLVRTPSEPEGEDVTNEDVFASNMYLDGSKEGHCVIFHPKCHPFKAIGPVSFLWKPIYNIQTHEYLTEIPANTKRKLWIWCHPSCYDELNQVFIDIFHLKEVDKSVTDGKLWTFACKLTSTKLARHFRKEKVFASELVKMTLLKNSFTRHRLIGPMSQIILSQVLSLADINDNEESENGSSPKRIKLDDNVNESKSLWWDLYYKDETLQELYEKKGELMNYLSDFQSQSYVVPRSIIGLTVRDPRMAIIRRKKEEKEEHKSEERFELYKDLEEFCSPEIADSALWNEDIRNEVTATKMPDKEINDMRANCIVAPGLGRRENRIPVLIIHQKGVNGFGYGWDLIAPSGWSSEFFRTLVFKGSRPVGLRDLHFINMEAGLPNFPCSYPDTVAGATYEEKLRIDGLKECYKHPKSQRPNFHSLGVTTPFFMCWKTLVSDWMKELCKQDVSNLFPFCDNLGLSKDNGGDHVLPSSGIPEFYVFRKPEIRLLNNLCQRLNRMPRDGFSSQEKNKLLEVFNNFINSLDPQIQFCRSLFPVKLFCLNKGTP